MDVIIKKRIGFATAEQKRRLIELVTNDSALSGDHDEPVKRNYVISAWDKITEELNSMEGVSKSKRSWKKTWEYIRNHCAKDQVQCEKLGDKEDKECPRPVNSNFNANVCQETEDELFIFSQSGECCRQMIRVVAQAVLHENKSPGEALAVLCSNSSYNCKKLEIWHQMQVVAMNKLTHLLSARDCPELLVERDRMNITDWLLFDTYLVHREFNVIGMAEIAKVDNRALVVLYELVDKYKVEYLEGDELAEAWCAVTMEYNKKRHTTPMLLQRRWYQLKLCTRKRFWKFWHVYQGFKTKLPKAKRSAPTVLQVKIAKQYQSLLLQPFVTWEKLIETNRVILREQFERLALQKREKLTAIPPAIPPVPQAVVIAVNMETNSTLAEIQGSSKDEDVMRPSNVNENVNMDIDESIPNKEQLPSTHLTERIEEGTAVEKSITKPITEIVSIPASQPEMDYEVTQDEKALDKENEIHPKIGVKTENGFDLINDDIDIEETVIVRPTVPPALPQITNIFSNVHVAIETLSKINALTAQTTDSTISNIFKSEPEREIGAADIEMAGTSNDDYCIPVSDDNSQTVSSLFEDFFDPCKPEVKIKPDVSTLLGELSNEFDSVDDQIQVLSEKAMHEENTTQIAQTATVSEVHEIAGEEGNENIRTKNKKLPRIPIVYTMKLEDMGILPLHLLEHVDDKNIINIINFKSKPVLKNNLKDTIRFKSKPVMNLKAISRCRKNSKRVQLSCSLFKKPHYRKYNPKKLWKNPDFNFILKNLSATFFKSTRNLKLLSKCKPLTVDLSKAFEKKLVNGTMYLRTSDDEGENISTIPHSEFAMAAQSLVDTIKESLPAVVKPAAVPNPVEASAHVSESNEITNFTEVSETCPSNQSHMTAEVMPPQLQQGSSQILTVPPKTDNLSVAKDSDIISGQSLVAGICKEDNVGNSTMNSSCNSLTPKKKARGTSRRLPCTCCNDVSTDSVFRSEILNILFNIFNGSQDDVNSEKTAFDGNSESTKTDNNIERGNIDDESAPTTLRGSEYNIDALAFQSDDCCWSRERLNGMKQFKKHIRRHDCPYPTCVCCCSVQLAEYCNRMALSMFPSADVIIQPEDDTINTFNANQFINDDDDTTINANSLIRDENSFVVVPDASNKSSVTATTVSNKVPAKSKANNKRKKCAKSNKIPDLGSDRSAEINVPAEDLETIDYSYEKTIDGSICLGKNEILLTTTKLPPNFKAFQEFERKTRRNLLLSNGIQLNILPNGRVVLNRHPSEKVSQKLMKTLSELVEEFYEQNEPANTQPINKTPHDKLTKESRDTSSRNEISKITKETVTKTPHDKLTKESRDTSSRNEISKITKETVTAVIQKRILTETKSVANSNENNNNTHAEVVISVLGNETVTTSNVEGTTESRDRHSPDFKGVLKKLKSGLGSLLFKSLTPITSIAELNYVRSQNGLFMKYDLDKGSLRPINVYTKATCETDTPIRTATITTVEPTELGLAVSIKPKPAADDDFSLGSSNNTNEPPRSLLKQLLLEKDDDEPEFEGITTAVPVPTQEFEALGPDQTINVSDDSSDETLTKTATPKKTIEIDTMIENETPAESQEVPVEGVSYPEALIISYLPPGINENADDAVIVNEALDEENFMPRIESEEEDCILGV